MIGGLSLGLILSYVTGYWTPIGGTLASWPSLVVLLAVLLVRPGGLFSGLQARHV